MTMQNRGHKTHRAYLAARIRVLRHEVEYGRHATFRKQSRRILRRLCGQLDDIDAAKAERVVV